MSSLSQRYYLRPAAAHVRASDALAGHGSLALSRSLDTLSPDHLEQIVRLGLEAGVEGLFRFKRSGVLPRVGKVLSMLRFSPPPTCRP